MTGQKEYRDITRPSTYIKDGVSAMDFTPRYLAVCKELQRRGEEMLRSPYMIELEPEATCQLDCLGCSYNEVRKVQIPDPYHRRLPIDTLKSVIDDVRGLDTHGIFISGGGEPLNYPKIEELIKFSGGNISPVSIQTNGIGLRKLLINKEALDNVRLISISIYGSDPKSFQATTGRGEGSFIDFKDSVGEFMRSKNQGALPESLIVNGKILITRGNCRDVVGMIRMCEDWEMDSIHLREIQNIETGFPLKEDKILTPSQREEMINLLEQLRDRSYVDRFLHIANASPIEPSSSCFSASMGMVAVIDTYGDVYIGTPEIGKKELAIGNIRQNHFREIWGGREHREVIRKMARMQRGRRCLIDHCRHAPSHRAIDGFLKNGGDAPFIEEVLKDPLGQFI